MQRLFVFFLCLVPRFSAFQLSSKRLQLTSKIFCKEPSSDSPTIEDTGPLHIFFSHMSINLSVKVVRCLNVCMLSPHLARLLLACAFLPCASLCLFLSFSVCLFLSFSLSLCFLCRCRTLYISYYLCLLSLYPFVALSVLFLFL